MRVIVDRIEGDMLVVELEDMTNVDIPRAVAPDANEGDVLDITVNDGETEARRLRIKEKMNRLRK